MKAKIEEYYDDETFFLTLTAETPEEASALARVAISHKKRGFGLETIFPNNKPVETRIYIAKKANYTPWI